MVLKQFPRTIRDGRWAWMSVSMLVVSVIALSAGSGVALADVSCKKIAYQPPTLIIDRSGVYCLKRSISANLDSGTAIDIRANNVVLELNGQKIGNLAAGRQNLARGITANGRRSITIRNGIIRGFAFAVLVTRSSSALSSGIIVENLTVEQSGIQGIVVQGSESTIRNNRVYTTGEVPESVSNLSRNGIAANGDNNSIIGNEVYDTSDPPGDFGGNGIEVRTAGSAFVSGNYIANGGPIIPGTVGVNVADGDVVIRNNVIAGVELGIFYDPPSDGIFTGNVIDRVIAGSKFGTDGGGNVVRTAP